ncbi:uncharacterized protein [Porites lutea]|uniref:uncharacterized protein n=1 Tax=Porites lutea TaxID=51062 RepID=UPI003CC533F5
MLGSTIAELFGHILYSFTRDVTEHYNPNEPEFTAESFGYNPLDSTEREWYCHPVDELIYQEYSDREATSLDYQVSRCVQVKLTDASSIENSEETHIASHEQREMAWKQLRPSVIRTICKSMYIGASISLFTAVIVGAIYILISYICYKTVHNCEFPLKNEIPVQVQWMRTISASILCAFLYIWYFTNALFLFRSFQLMGVKRKLILISGTFYFLDAVYRVLLQYLGVSESRLSALQKIPVNALFFTSLFAQTYLVTKLLSGRLWSRKQKLILFFQMVVPWSFSFLVSILITTFIYPLYNAQNKNGKLIIALFAPLIGVFVKVISRISVQRLYNITHPGYSFVLLVPLYSGAAVIFRILQADLGRLQTIALLGIIHGAAEVIERSTMVFIDHICHQLVKRRSAPWGSFRTPRRERLMADITIMSMMFESAAIVSVNGFLYLYQYVYLTNKPLLTLLQRFAIHTSVQLVIEWFFTSVSLAIETRYQNIAVMAVWQKRWKRHILVAIVSAFPIAIWTDAKILIIVHGRFHELLTQTCKMPFT